jgi:hypothetical protein
MPGRITALREQRRLGIAHHAADRHAAGQNAAASVSPNCAALSRTSGSARGGTSNSAQSSGVPAQLADVEQERAAGVGEVGGKNFSAGEPVNEIGVHGADNGVAAFEFGGEVRFVRR